MKTNTIAKYAKLFIMSVVRVFALFVLVMVGLYFILLIWCAVIHQLDISNESIAQYPCFAGVWAMLIFIAIFGLYT